MTGEPRVSVIINFLNAERFLAEAVESVFAQTYSDWELLLVDDGSTDESPAIAERYARESPERVRCLKHPEQANLGTSASRNLGIAQARGVYIAFLDAGDVWLAEKLAVQVGLLDGFPTAGLVYGPTEWWYSWSGETEDQRRDFVHDLGVPPDTLLKPPTLLAPFFFDQQAAIPGPTSFVVRRDVARSVGGCEESFSGAYQPYEDQAFLAKVCLSAPIVASSRCLDRYRQHKESAVARMESNGQSHVARRFFLNWLAAYLAEQRVSDPAIWEGLRRAQQPYEHPLRHRLKSGYRSAVRQGRSATIGVATRTLPLPMRRWLWSKWTRTDYAAPPGWVRFGSLRRLTPFSREFGYDRGLPVDRYYIECFLQSHTEDVGGRVLEIADNAYTMRFGADRVTRSDVLHVVAGNPKATIVGDLASADHIPSCTFDCVIFTQTLQLIYEPLAALRTIHRILKPGGVVLATFPGISQISSYDMERWGYYWSFTSCSARRLFEEAFPCSDLEVATHGNVLAASALLYGLAADELRPSELDFLDPDFEVTIAVRAKKYAIGEGHDEQPDSFGRSGENPGG